MMRWSNIDVLAAVDGKTALARSAIDFVHMVTRSSATRSTSARPTSSRCSATQASSGHDTAFRAVLAGSRPCTSAWRSTGRAAVADDGSLRPTHSCGHGPIAGSVVAAGGETCVPTLPAFHRRDRAAPRTRSSGARHRRAGGRKLLSLEVALWKVLHAALLPPRVPRHRQSEFALHPRAHRLVVSGARSRDAARQLALQAAARRDRSRSRADKLMLEHVTFDHARGRHGPRPSCSRSMATNSLVVEVHA